MTSHGKFHGTIWSACEFDPLNRKLQLLLGLLDLPSPIGSLGG
jgi:hypothetical protein